MKQFEPNSSPTIERIDVLKRLHDAGLKTWVSIEPYPTPNFIEQNLIEILEKVSFVDYIVFGKLNYNPKVKEYPNYRQFYEDMANLVEDFCKKKGIKFHIKEGTKRVYNSSTATILSDN